MCIVDTSAGNKQEINSHLYLRAIASHSLTIFWQGLKEKTSREVKP